MNDPVHNPEHYCRGGIEPQEFMRAHGYAGPEWNVVKYVFRHSRKNGIEDLWKALQYLAWAIQDANFTRASRPDLAEFLDTNAHLGERERATIACVHDYVSTKNTRALHEANVHLAALIHDEMKKRMEQQNNE